MKLALKIDVDTLRGTSEGVPKLIEILGRHGAGATFLFSLGPDHTGRAIKRALRPGFMNKVGRTSVVSHYGIRTLLYGTVLPGPDIGKRCAGRHAARARRGIRGGNPHLGPREMAGRRGRRRRAMDAVADGPRMPALPRGLRRRSRGPRRRRLADERARVAPHPGPGLPLRIGYARHAPVHPRDPRGDRRLPAVSHHAADPGRDDRGGRRHGGRTSPTGSSSAPRPIAGRTCTRCTRSSRA